MASILQVNQIQHTNGTSSMTIGTDGHLTGPGVGKMVTLQSDTTGATTSALEIDLSTSTDYAYQMLSLRGFCSSSVADMYMTLRKQSNSTYFSDSYLSIIGSLSLIHI